jgi:type IV pilus assembly protein PilB
VGLLKWLPGGLPPAAKKVMSQTLIQWQPGALTSQDLEVSLIQASAKNLPLLDFLIHERNVPEGILAETFSQALNLPRVDLATTTLEPPALKAVTSRLALKHTCLPIRFSGKSLVLAMANPLDRAAIQDVEFASSRKVQPVIASRAEILDGIRRHYPGESRRPNVATPERDVLSVFSTEGMDLDSSRETAPAIELCNQLVLDATKVGASDIHIEAGQREMRVRLRVDGVLRDHLVLPDWLRVPLLSRIKILAKLDIAEQRLPQDGRFQFQTPDGTIHIRVSTLPTHFGEKAVLRLLRSAQTPTLAALGFSRDEMTVLEDALHQPQGLVLVTGPTGAGKSTTLYSMLTRRQSSEINVVTIEDPIEYQLPGANQVQVNSKAGVTFASSLRAILRQDPDVIMVGEIRDAETAEIVFHAAQTGHLVLSSLHTNSALAAIERLLNLDVKPVTINAATNLVIAQRLARRVCSRCRVPYMPSPEVLERLHLEVADWDFQRGAGCEACNQTGYSGRVGLYEIQRLTPKLKDLVSRHSTERALKRAALSAGAQFLLDDGLSKVRRGLTTVEELLRVIRIEHAEDVPSSSGRVRGRTLPQSTDTAQRR